MCSALDGGELPVLDLEDEDAATRMKHDEVRIAGLGANRDVAPAEVIVFQQLFQPLGEAPLASGIELALGPNGAKNGPFEPSVVLGLLPVELAAGLKPGGECDAVRKTSTALPRYRRR